MFPLDAILGVGMKLVDKFFPDPEAKAKAQLELMQMQQNGELAKINADIAEAQEITKRWEADMASDSWLSKNIRPLALIAIFTAYFLFTAMSAFGYNAQESYVNLLGSWGQIVFLAYFGGRTVEKCIEMKAKKNDD
jgi:uncharacterized membrane protein (DUF106 family)